MRAMSLAAMTFAALMLLAGGAEAHSWKHKGKHGWGQYKWKPEVYITAPAYPYYPPPVVYETRPEVYVAPPPTVYVPFPPPLTIVIPIN